MNEGGCRHVKDTKGRGKGELITLVGEGDLPINEAVDILRENGMYNIQGTLGGIKGSTNHLDWKYYSPEEAPAQHLVTEVV